MSEQISHLIQSFRFWDVVTQWSRERLEHEDIVARALAAAIIRDGLLCFEADPCFLSGEPDSIALRGYPWVGYRSSQDSEVTVLRATTLAHLLAVVERGEAPDRGRLAELVVRREAFSSWLEARGLGRPSFWFSKPKTP